MKYQLKYLAGLLCIVGPFNVNADTPKSHQIYSCKVVAATWMEFDRNVPNISSDRSPESDRVTIEYKDYGSHHEISVESENGFIYWNASTSGFHSDVRYVSVTRGGDWFNYSSPNSNAWSVRLNRVYKEDWLGFLVGGFQKSRMVVGVDCKRQLLRSDALDG